MDAEQKLRFYKKRMLCLAAGMLLLLLILTLLLGPQLPVLLALAVLLFCYLFVRLSQRLEKRLWGRCLSCRLVRPYTADRVLSLLLLLAALLFYPQISWFIANILSGGHATEQLYKQCLLYVSLVLLLLIFSIYSLRQLQRRLDFHAAANGPAPLANTQRAE